MVTPIPQRADKALFNEVTLLARDDAEANLKMSFRLRSALRKYPSSPVLKVALATVFSHLGACEKALTVLDGIDVGGDHVLGASLQGLLCDLGQYDHSRVILARLKESQELSGEVLVNAFIYALVSGDFSLLGDSEKHSLSRMGQGNNIIDIISALSEAGIFDKIKGHQDIVSEALSGHQCLVGIDIDGFDVSGAYFIYHYVDFSVDDAVSVSDEIVQKLCDYYMGQDMDPGCWVGVFQPMIIPIQVHRL